MGGLRPSGGDGEEWQDIAMSYLPSPTDLVSYPTPDGSWGNLGADLRRFSGIPQLRWDPVAAANQLIPGGGKRWK